MIQHYYDKINLYSTLPYTYELNFLKKVDRGKNKGEKNMNTSIDTENALDNIQHLFMIKFLSKLGTEGNFPKLMKVIYNKTSN